MEAFLTQLNRELVKDTIYETKKNDKVLFVKVGLLNCLSNDGYDSDEVIEKIKDLDEKDVIAFANDYFMDYEIYTIDDAIEILNPDTSIIDNFFWSYGYYFGYTVDEMFKKNFENGNYDGIFELMTKDEKFSVMELTYIKLSSTFKSIYSDEYLIRVWSEILPEVKEEALRSKLFEGK